MMRVHLRGVVIGVATVLSIAVIVSIFNAIDAPSDDNSAITRHVLSTEDENDADSSAQGGARQRPAGGPRGARAGGPGARAGGPGARAGGPGARAGGPGARAGGPGARAGGPGARAGGPGARAGGPGARAGGRFGGAAARAGGAGARAGTGGPAGRMGGAMARGGARGRAAAGSLGDEDEDMGLGMEDEAPPRPRGRAGAASGRMSGRFAGAGSRARGRFSASDDEEETPRPRAPKRKAKAKKSEEKKEEKEEEKTTEAPKKKEPPYPEWWKTSYPRSAVSSLQDQFVGDQPLFPECPNFEVDSVLKAKRFGPVEPPNFMRNSKNPCWFEWNGKKDILKCLPYFYLAGVAKSATADIFNRVRNHPSVMAGGSISYYWWDRLRYGASKNLKYTREAKRMDDPVSLKEYAKELVGKHGKNVTKELLYKGRSESIFGDASPTYLTENTQWDVFEGNQGCSEPRVIPANFIRHIFPDARIIIILRDPVERLYSRFLANVPYVQEFENATASLFHTFTVQAIQTYRECFAKSSVRHCAYNASLFTNAVIRLSEGMYPVFLEDWFRVFPREQILILKFDEYVQDIKGHLIKIFQHLGLDTLDEYNLLKMTDIPLTRKGRTREEEGYMMPETEALLSDFYSPFMLKLADMLDDEKWQFKREGLPHVRVNLEAHEEGNEDAMPATGQQQHQEPESPKESADLTVIEETRAEVEDI